MHLKERLQVAAAVVLVVFAVLACKASGGSAGGSATSTTITTFKAGDDIDVEWNGEWWKASVIAVEGTTYKVHYVGWGAEWDESVLPSRVRARTAGAKSK
jgi:hypothetical protein